MKQVTLRELHERTGTLVREAVRLGGMMVTDRGNPIARLEPAGQRPSDKPFKHRRILAQEMTRRLQSSKIAVFRA
jgi:antitoxin (DNA-binding transcriptional repressor) of toxin-antitoxin stability system